MTMWSDTTWTKDIVEVIFREQTDLDCRVLERYETGSTTTAQKKFRLSARISSDDPSAVKPILERLISRNGTIKSIEQGFEVEADLEGESARALNRMLLSEMRKAEKRTRIRAEWTSGNMIEKFFDYVPKGTRKANQ